MLLFGVGDNETMAVPLSLVARLEEFPLESIELNGGRKADVRCETKVNVTQHLKQTFILNVRVTEGRWHLGMREFSVLLSPALQYRLIRKIYIHDTSDGCNQIYAFFSGLHCYVSGPV